MSIGGLIPEAVSSPLAQVQMTGKPAHEYISGFNSVLLASLKSNHGIQILLGGRDVANRIYYTFQEPTIKLIQLPQ
ncbi:hypothetical protein PHMEG_0005234 [Phytophthora megakarya]|uniref:Uncharacterized protein n=1 Tax=Phytophthora megakarya TaxID=4795 RepID=A0A225WS02_9STRA|nr:hypothetical protein PHMEG_0005234 [Phytophthora megakarya]